jgi:hypothetical protein
VNCDFGVRLWEFESDVDEKGEERKVGGEDMVRCVLLSHDKSRRSPGARKITKCQNVGLLCVVLGLRGSRS